MRTSLLYRFPLCAMWVPLALGALMFAATSPAFAGGAREPMVCDQDDAGERIKCKTGNVLDQQEATAEMMMDLPSLSESQKGRLHNLMGRGGRSMERTSGADFKELTKKMKAKCQILPADPDDADGICTGSETCAELNGDGIGNDDGTCRTRGKPSEREVCVEICDDEAMAQPENFDDDPNNPLNLAADIEQGLDDATAEYIEVNDMLKEVILSRAAAQVVAQGTDPCEAALQARRDELLVFGFIIGATTAEGVAGQFDTVCDQTIAGFNGKSVCLVFQTIAAIANILKDGFEFEDSGIDSTHIDATLECVKSLDDAAEGTEAQLDEVQAQLNQVQGQLVEVQAQLALTLELLKTPQGQREGFPAKPATSQGSPRNSTSRNRPTGTQALGRPATSPR